MWPWEHLAVGYLAYSLWCRLGRRRPGGLAVVALAFATQLPDLVDKPLGWVVGLVPSGQSLGHSLVFALPVIAFVALISLLIGRRSIGAAFGIGYLSHLPGDMVFPALVGGSVRYEFLLWPFVEVSTARHPQVWEYVAELFDDFLAFLTTGPGMAYLFAELALLAVTFALWRGDGYPGVPRPRRSVTPGT